MHRLGRQLLGDTSVLIQNDNLQLTNLTLTTHSLLKKLKNYPVMDMGDCCKKVFSSLSVDTMDILNRSQRDKSFWESCRQFRITGSRCYGLYTYHKTPKTDAKWSLKASRYLWPKSFTNKFVKHGIQYESDAKHVYIKNTNQTILECGLVTNPSNPWLGYTPDGVIVDDKNVPVKIIEIKCPFKGKTSTISDLINDLKYIIKNQDGSYSLKPNHSYYAQIQLGLVILNVTVCDFIIYSSYEKNYFLIQVSFDEMFCKTMLNNLKIVYFERLLHEICIFTKLV